tara:strand:+ start:620 stop:1267 length:648 start_codon:yes stop_codon:yes gene_type:complete
MSTNLKKRLITSIILLSLIILIMNSNYILLYCLIVLGTLSILEFLNISKKIYKSNLIKIIVNLLFLIYLSLFCLIFFYFSQVSYLNIILFSLLFGCVASDIGGYIFGKIFKGPRLTKISPNKTISGALGSLFLTYVTISTFLFLYTNTLSYKLFLISVITSIACQFGDLFFSFLKRKAKVKDTGKIFPGHGGVLDRIDGILIGLPIGHISFIIIY